MEPFDRVCGVQFLAVLLGESHVGEDVVLGFVHENCQLGHLGPELVGDLTPLGLRAVGVLLGEGWFWAAYLMATHSNGISALQLQKQLALGSYRTAWMLAAKLRRAMVDPDRNPLSGLVEIDETSLPFRTKNDPASGGPGRSHDGKLLVVGGIEVGDGNKPGRLRLAALTDYGAGSLNAFIARNIAPASTAKTDGWAGYAGVPVDQHDPHVIGAMAAHLVLPWIHQMFSNLKGWARGVYHGLRRKYLQTYLDEFVFRFNRRRTRHPTFRSMFAIAIRTKPVTYNMLVAPEQSA